MIRLNQNHLILNWTIHWVRQGDVKRGIGNRRKVRGAASLIVGNNGGKRRRPAKGEETVTSLQKHIAKQNMLEFFN